MIAAIIKSAVILAGAGCIAVLLRRQSAALRHAVWTAGLAGALAIPFFSIALPAWPNRIVGEAASFAGEVVQTSILPYVASGDAPLPNTASEQLSTWAVRDIAVTVWLAGAAIGFLLMICGAARLAWVAVRAEPIDDPRWKAVAGEIGESLGLRRRVHLLQNRSVRFLGTWGITSPRILLPAGAETWSDERIRLVLAHELAHIRRRDWPVQVLAEAARAIYWFNPLFWIACSQLRQESEHACDDTVVRLGAPGTRYAEELLDLTRSLRDSPAVRSPMLAMAQPSHLERRLIALLNPTLNRLAATPWAVLVVASAAVVLTLPLAAVRSPEEPETAATLAAVSVPAPSMPAAPPPPPPSVPVSTQEATPQPVGNEGLPPALNVAATDTGSTRSPAPEEAQIGFTEGVTPLAAAAAALPVPSMPVALPPQPTLSVPAAAPEVTSQPATKEVPPPVLHAAVNNTRPTRNPTPVLASRQDCRETPIVMRKSTDREKTAALGSGPWHINREQTIWAWDQPYTAGREINSMWIRPLDKDLTIRARRTDGSESFQTTIASKYSTNYVSATLLFPAPGCWEVTGVAGNDALTFITWVEAH